MLVKNFSDFLLMMNLKPPSVEAWSVTLRFFLNLLCDDNKKVSLSTATPDGDSIKKKLSRSFISIPTPASQLLDNNVQRIVYGRRYVISGVNGLGDEINDVWHDVCTYCVYVKNDFHRFSLTSNE